MIINLTSREKKSADKLNAKIKMFTKDRKYDKASNLLNKKGLKAKDLFFKNCDKLIEIYEPYFDKLQRQKGASTRGAAYQRSLERIQKRGW